MITFENPWNRVGIGNHFFIYSYMRLMAENLNYKMVSPPMLFSERNRLHSQTYYQFKNIDTGIDNTGNEKYGIDDGFSFRNENIDEAIDFFKSKNHHIISCGWYQKYSYWKKYKDQVKGFFTDFISEDKMGNNDIAIHLRHSLENPITKINADYYINAIEKMGGDKVYLFADNFSRHEDILEKLKPYNPIIMNLNVPDSIKEITKFNKIICSQGSFSFWVSFLSNAEKIIWPITKIGPNKIEDNWSIDYVVDDEPRYEFIML
jgi:hypothetical protein